jgi:pimeloyl-ACP methyl ester carboxylesterase
MVGMRLLPLAMLFAATAFPATVDGIRLHYTASGSGPTVIFVHGWTCDESTWSEQRPALESRYRVVTIDLPGHGKSGSPKIGRLTMNLFARAVEAVRAELGANRVVLVGHSMGTPVIVQYERMYPRHVAAMVFVDGVVIVAKGRRPNTDQMRGAEGLRVREGNTRSMFSKSTSPELQEKILKMMMAAPESTAIQAMAAMYDPTIWRGDVISTPILGLYAEHSGLGAQAYMKAHFTHFQYTEIPETGHFLMLERPVEFNRLLLAFLERQKF